MLRRRLLTEWCAIAALAAAVVAGLVLSRATARLDNTYYDLVVGLRASPPSDRIVIIAIDDSSLSALGRWPWDRNIHARAIRQIASADPAVLVYGILFTEPGASPEVDAALGAALATTPTVLPLLIEMPGSDGRATNIVPPVPPIARGATALGHVALPHEEDGSSRAALLAIGQDDDLWLHAMEWAHRLALGRPSAAMRRGEQAVYVPFLPESGGFRTIPFDTALRGEVPDTFFENKIVLVGVTARGLGDRHTVPLRAGGTVPGVEVHANLLSALIADRLVHKVSRGGELAFALLAPLLLLLAFWFLRPNRALLASLMTIGAVLVFPVALLVWGGLWLPPAAALAGLLIGYPLWGWRRLQAVDDAISAELRIFASEALISPGAEEIAPASDPVGWQTAQLSASIAKLRNLRSLIGDALEGIADPLVVTTMTDQVVVANRRATSLLGADVAEGDLSKLVRCVCEEKEVELDGRIFSPRRTPLSSDRGEQRGWILLLAEITAIREAEREREEAIEFLSHDIRSPQVSIVNLLESEASKLPPGVAERLVDHARRTLELADGFVQFARLRHQPFIPEPTDLCASIAEAMDALWPQANARDIRVSARGLEEPRWVLGERDTLTRLFTNLIGNAIKFIPRGGEVRCGATASDDGSSIIAHVEDNGPGIPADRTDALFERFGPVTADGNGSGLGLAYVRKAARRHGGAVAFEEVQPHGSRFTVTLPAFEDAED